MPPAMAPTDPRSDEALVAAADAGDAHAFEALYLRHRSWAADLAWRFLRDRDAAGDVMQEAFLQLLGRFPGFRLTSRLRTFLYPVVKHIAIDRLRKIRRGVGADDTAVEELPAPVPADGEPLRDIERAVETLPAGQREVLLMRFVDDLALQEIAVALDVPLGTVKSRLHNALEALRGDPKLRELFEAPGG
jgi:RNA polymerase sigma-70 factor (ECF subfamily)